MSLLNVYSCGCTALDVPPLSRCKTHSGHVVAAAANFAGPRRSFLSDDKRVAILYDSTVEGMRRLKDASVGLIFSYPDQFLFTVRSLIDPASFLHFPDTYFPECRRVLRPYGSAVLIVETFALSAVVYCAHMAGFRVDSTSVVRLPIIDEPLVSDFVNEYYVYKACVTLSLRNSPSSGQVRDMSLKSSPRLIDRLYPGKGLILDTSCIHYPFVMSARKTAKTVGIITDLRRYRAMRRLIKSLDTCS